jgi:hypothetical protein
MVRPLIVRGFRSASALAITGRLRAKESGFQVGEGAAVTAR